MTGGREFLAAAVAVGLVVVSSAAAGAAQCGNGPGGFEAWKQQIAGEARANGIGANGINALMGASYASATIAADRSLHSFKLSLDQFMVKRGSAAIVARGRSLKQSRRRCSPRSSSATACRRGR